MPVLTASDGVRLSYECAGREHGVTRSIILLHGWSASRRSFDLNAPLIAERCMVVTPDLRFHGESEKPAWGFHVARLAADLRELILETGLDRPVVVGCSLGAAVIWSFIELFGCTLLGGVVFVDQAPSQWRLPDWPHCSKGIYDEASLASITAALHAGMSAFAVGNAQCCLTKPVPATLLQTLNEDTKRCDPTHLAKLMRDHAQIDWRPILPRITLPALNLYGSLSGCFPIEGLTTVGDLIPGAVNHLFDGCNHWLYMEEPLKFNTLILDFVAGIGPMS